MYSLELSTVATLMTRVKCYVCFARKNRILAYKVYSFYTLLCEQLVPQYIEMHSESKEVVSDIHAVCFILTQKLH